MPDTATMFERPKCPRQRPTPEIRITRSFERDFENRTKRQQLQVLEAFASPFRPGKIKPLRPRKGAKLWRMELPDIRIIMATPDGQHVDYAWRIDDRKDIYDIVDNLDARIPFTGVTVKEFLMKNNKKNNSSKPPISPDSASVSNGALNPHTSTAVTAIVPTVASHGNGLLKELSTYIGLQLCDDLNLAKDVLREDFKRLEANVKEHGEWITVCDAQQTSLSALAGQLVCNRERARHPASGADQSPRRRDRKNRCRRWPGRGSHGHRRRRQ